MPIGLTFRTIVTLLPFDRRTRWDIPRVWPAAIAAHRDAALLLMGFAGVHRRSELTALRISDVTVHSTDGCT